MPFRDFHPAVRAWAEQALVTPTPPQAATWPKVREGGHVLVAAPTGSGKTLAAFLTAIDDLVRRGEDGPLPDRVQVLYVSPLRALSHDVEKNLEAPLAGIDRELARLGRAPHGIRSAVRTGDTTASARAALGKRPPHVLVTTPESLYLLLTSASGRKMLGDVRTVIVDEIHALAPFRRGAHLALSLARLDALVGREVQRIGLSATQTPIETVARFLVGGDRPCAIVDVGHRRPLDIELVLPRSPLEGVLSLESWEEVFDQIADLVRAHRTTLVFVTSRRTAERVAGNLATRLGPDAVTSHHGSLGREHRLDAEQRLKRGELQALVATSSLELGIDVGDVDLVIQLGSPRGLNVFVQRTGRAGHRPDATPKARVFPLSRDDLVECAALLACVRRGELDELVVRDGALDVLAQQIVATCVVEDQSVDALYAAFTATYPYRDLTRERFDAVVHMLAEGFVGARGRAAALVHLDAVAGRLAARKRARLAVYGAPGTIPDTFDYEVRLEPDGFLVGTLHEDFAIESMAGDVFTLGATSYRIVRVERGVVRVADAKGAPPSIPFWIADAPMRSDALSREVGALFATYRDTPEGERVATIAARYALDAEAATQIDGYLGPSLALLGTLPDTHRVVLERFFDEAGSMHLVAHAPLGGRLLRAFALALRKRFCRTFNVELQAAAIDDAFVLSLGPMHAMPLEDVPSFLHANTVRDVLTQALLDLPMFGTRFRWNATTALAVPKRRGGKRVAPYLQRMIADDLLALAFPDQVACAENLSGPREVPDHPLVAQTLVDCLEEAMDVRGLERLLVEIAEGRTQVVVRDVPEPSALTHAVLGARPWAFLDDAPLEERRTQAVTKRRFLDAKTAASIAALDPEAIARVREEQRPIVRDADELHDALLRFVVVPLDEARALDDIGALDALLAAERATLVRTPGARFVVAAERLRTGLAGLREPTMERPIRAFDPEIAREDALRELARGRLHRAACMTVIELARELDLDEADAQLGLFALEAEGAALRGRFTQGAAELEMADRALLARIHRYTLDGLRKRIEPVEPGTLLRYYATHQGVVSTARRRGVEGLAAALAGLDGFEAPASAWESDILPARVLGYQPYDLDALCFSGRIAWARLSPPATATRAFPVRTMPVALVARASMEKLRRGPFDEDGLGADARVLLELLRTRGATFADELAATSKLLPSQIDAALAELVFRGLATSDAFAGLRALLGPERGLRPRGKKLDGRPTGGRRPQLAVTGRFVALGTAPELDHEHLVRALLDRWGVIVRRVIEHEDRLPPWRELVRVLRRMEASGDVRGGRFVASLGGEQFALPAAVPALRGHKDPVVRGELVSLCASDPLNLVDIAVPGVRLARTGTSRLLLRDGVPVAVREGEAFRLLVDASRVEAATLERAIAQRAPAHVPRDLAS